MLSALAQYKAGLRQAADAKRQKIETELHAIAESETERRRFAEAEAQKQIKEQASRFEQEAQAAQKRVDEARRLADLEIQKREEAEAAKLRAEEEARRLAAEILEVHRHIEEIKIHTSKSTNDQTLNLIEFQKSQQSRELNISQKNLSPENQTNSSSTENIANQTVPLFQADFDAPKDTTEIHHKSNENIVGLLNTSPIAKRKLSVPLMIAGALAAFFVVAFGGVGIYYFAIMKPENAEVSNVNKKITEPPGKSPTPTVEIKNEMVLIEGGSFQMGKKDVPKNDRLWGDQYPAHPVSVNSFYINKTEISNMEYAEFVQAKNYQAPSLWKNNKPPDGEEKLPVTNVSLDDAKAYADWVSKREKKICRLPTEAEWEFAARNGAQSTSFPWGDDWRVGSANLATGKASEVGTFSDETSNGIKDMLGNVLEWTSSKYALYPGHPGKLDDNDEYLVARGSSWSEQEERLKKNQWLLTRRHSTPAETKSPFLGFRIVCQP